MLGGLLLKSFQADARSGSTRVQALPPCSAPFYGVVLKGDSNNSQARFMTEKEKNKSISSAPPAAVSESSPREGSTLNTEQLL